MKETYNELSVTPSCEYDCFADFILTLTQDAIEERDGTIIVRSENELNMVEFGVKVFADNLEKVLDKRIEIKTKLVVKNSVDWISVYKQSIQPIEVGGFYIHPSWVNQKKDKLNVSIDPALAFGSGHHETTYGSLLMLDKYLEKKYKVLDVGCGSGILSIASAKLGVTVDLCDTDELAVKSARSNFKLNNVKYNNLWIGSIREKDGQYDIVVANIIADILIALASNLINATKDDGLLILSGILEKYLNRVRDRFTKMEILEEYNKDEWYTLVLKKVKI